MLPEILSNDHCSLSSETDKLTLSAWMDYDKDGKFISIQISETIIRSLWRGDYDSVGRYIAMKHPEEKDTPKSKDSILPPTETHTLLGDFEANRHIAKWMHDQELIVPSRVHQ